MSELAVTYIRHGEDQNDLKNWMNDAPLLEEWRFGDTGEITGQQMATHICEEAISRGKDNVQIYVSPKQRAVQTSDLFIPYLEQELQVSRDTDYRIREFDQGVYLLPEGYQSGGHYQPLQDAWLALVQEITENNLDYRYGSAFVNGKLKYPELSGHFFRHGENQAEFSERFYDFIIHLMCMAEIYPDTHFVIVTHAATVVRTHELLAVMEDIDKGRLNGFDPKDMGALEWERLTRAEEAAKDMTGFGGFGTVDISTVRKNIERVRASLSCLTNDI